jgi:hypothetical protein
MHILPLRQARAVVFTSVLAIGILFGLRPAALASPRIWEPLVLRGEQFPTLSGAAIDRLEILAIHGRKAEPVPFQVDEISKDGRYVLPDGPEANPTEGDGRLKDKDEILMMLSDLGEKGDDNPALPRDTLEIKVSDPMGGPDRYAYMAASDSPRLSDRRYVRYDAEKDVVETERYRIGLTNGLPTNFATQDRMDEHGPNLIDRLKVRLSTLVLHLFRFSFSEGDIRTRLLAWKVGPVRVIRRLSHSVNLVLGLGSPAFERHDLFYRDFLDNPFRMDLAFAPRLFFGDIRVRIDLDFNGLRGYELLWSGMTMPPIKLGDPGAEQEITRQASIPVSWMAIRGRGNLVVQTLYPTPDLALLSRRLYFNDSSRPDPPEGTPGEHPGIGYVITGWEKLGSGVHRFDSLLITTAADYSADVLLEEMRTRPVVTVEPVTDGK